MADLCYFKSRVKYQYHNLNPSVLRLRMGNRPMEFSEELGAISLDWLTSDFDAHNVREYPSGQYLHDYNLSLLQRFRALISTIAVLPFTQELIQMHINILLPRNIAAILYHSAGDLLS